MFRRRECALFHFAHVRVCRRGGIIPQMRERLGEARRARLVEAEHVVHHEHLAVALGAGADADSRDCDARSYFARQRRRHALDHDRKCARGFERGGVLEQSLAASGSVARFAALHAMPAHPMDRLRRQPDMTHHGNIDRRDSRHRVRDRDSPFELHRFRPAFLDEAPGVTQRVFGTHLVREERHVGDDQRAAPRPRDRTRVVDDLVDRDRERGVLAAHRHAETIADEQHVDAAVVEDPREWKVVRGQHRDRLMRGLHAREIGHANFFLHHISLSIRVSCSH